MSFLVPIKSGTLHSYKTYHDDPPKWVTPVLFWALLRPYLSAVLSLSQIHEAPHPAAVFVVSWGYFYTLFILISIFYLSPVFIFWFRGSMASCSLRFRALFCVICSRVLELVMPFYFQYFLWKSDIVPPSPIRHFPYHYSRPDSTGFIVLVAHWPKKWHRPNTNPPFPLSLLYT